MSRWMVEFKSGTRITINARDRATAEQLAKKINMAAADQVVTTRNVMVVK